MKICGKCGNRNYFKPGDKISCKECGDKLNNQGKGATMRDGLKLKGLLHDEYPWEM